MFSDLVPGRKREVGSAVAHYIAGVLDREAMVDAVETHCQATILQPGNRVKTPRGTMHGSIVSILEDGRVVWRADSRLELTALPESLVTETKR